MKIFKFSVKSFCSQGELQLLVPESKEDAKEICGVDRCEFC